MRPRRAKRLPRPGPAKPKDESSYHRVYKGYVIWQAWLSKLGLAKEIYTRAGEEWNQKQQIKSLEYHHDARSVIMHD